MADFWAKVVRDPDTDCWEWLGTRTHGYGSCQDAGRSVRAHRYAYEALVGPIPPGLIIDHLCRNRGCVNPEHLEPVTNQENVLRGVGVTAQNARKTHCPQGHPYDEANTYRGRGWRECRRCAIERQNVRRSLTRASTTQEGDQP